MFYNQKNGFLKLRQNQLITKKIFRGIPKYIIGCRQMLLLFAYRLIKHDFEDLTNRKL